MYIFVRDKNICHFILKWEKMVFSTNKKLLAITFNDDWIPSSIENIKRCKIKKKIILKIVLIELANCKYDVRNRWVWGMDKFVAVGMIFG